MGVPNTFQTFNYYVDRAMELLTDSELRVLLFTTRHIMGWQEKINARQGYISLSMYEKGFTDKSQNHYGGCGLSRPTIIAATNSLVEYGFMEKVGKPTSKGQKWQLSDGDVDWDKLEARRAEKLAKNKDQTAKATAASIEKRTGTSDDTSNVERTSTSNVERTDDGTSNVLNQTHVQTHDQTHKNKRSKKAAALSDLETALRDAIVDAFISEGVWGREYVGNSEYGMATKSAKVLAKRDVPLATDEIAPLLAWCRTQERADRWHSFLPAYLDSKVTAWRTATRPAVKDPEDDWQPPPPEEQISDAQKAEAEALLEALVAKKTGRPLDATA